MKLGVSFFFTVGTLNDQLNLFVELKIDRQIEWQANERIDR